MAVHPRGTGIPCRRILRPRRQAAERTRRDRRRGALVTPALFLLARGCAGGRFLRQANDSLATFVAQSDGSTASRGTRRARGSGPNCAGRCAHWLRGARSARRRGRAAWMTALDSSRGRRGAEVPVLPPVYGHTANLSDFYMTNLTATAGDLHCSQRLILRMSRRPSAQGPPRHAGGYAVQFGRLDHGFRVRSETNAAISSPPRAYCGLLVRHHTHAGKRSSSSSTWSASIVSSRDRSPLTADVVFGGLSAGEARPPTLMRLPAQCGRPFPWTADRKGPARHSEREGYSIQRGRTTSVGILRSAETQPGGSSSASRPAGSGSPSSTASAATWPTMPPACRACRATRSSDGSRPWGQTPLTKGV